MWRTLLLTLLLAVAATPAAAQPLIQAWETCRGALVGGGPRLTSCRRLDAVIDPQAREIWLRASVRPKSAGENRPSAVYVFGATSSQAWFNGASLGSNGTPAPTAAAERPGFYEAAFPIAPHLWRPGGQELIVRMSAFHVGMRFDHPVNVGIGRYPQPTRAPQTALTFIAAGLLMAACLGFGAIYATRGAGSILVLSAMAGVAAMQAGVEAYRTLFNYPYPLHVWRMNAIWGLSAAFALLLVAFAASRFLPRRRNVLLAAAAAAIAATYLLKGFDLKSSAALLAGAGFATIAAALGVHDRRSGARPVLAYLLVFLAVGVAQPFWLLDLSFFLLAAGLTLPLLVAEVIRLGRDDREREAALTRAASRPDRLTVATGRGVALIPLHDIVAILGADDYAELRLRGGRSLLHAARLDRLEGQLPARFLRTHRSAIASLDHVERLERDGSRWRLHMSEGPDLPVSRGRLAAVRDALDAPPAPLRATG